eukprot:COSAG01_NODE_71670_length_255_cov_0.660256_1_plen_43_part_10
MRGAGMHAADVCRRVHKREQRELLGDGQLAHLLVEPLGTALRA